MERFASKSLELLILILFSGSVIAETAFWKTFARSSLNLPRLAVVVILETPIKFSAILK